MILDETQKQRDQELSEITGLPLDEIEAFALCGPDAIRIFDDTLALPETESDMVGLYSDYRYLNVPAYLRTLMFTSVERRHPELFGLLRSTQGKRCLDFGSGVGTHAIALSESGNDVTMLDVRGPLSRFAEKRFERRGLAYAFVSHTEPLLENSFDVVVCTDVLEHVNSPVQEFRRIISCLRPGGVMHLQVSDMVKHSSGHFKRSIDLWKSEGVSLLDQTFDALGETTYMKRESTR